jgi:hypothetical protein
MAAKPRLCSARETDAILCGLSGVSSSSSSLKKRRLSLLPQLVILLAATLARRSRCGD